MAPSTLLLDSLIHSTEPSEPHQLSTFTRVKPSGRLIAIVDATSTILGLRSTRADLLDLADGQHVTVVTRNLAPVFSTPQIHAWQGRIVQQPGLTAFKPKGARTRGYDLARLGDVLDIVPGFGPEDLDEARKRIEAVTALFAQATDLTPDSFTALPTASNATFEAPCTMALVTTLVGPDQSRVNGALWLLRDRIPDPDMPGDTLNGVLIVPPSTLTSEHGSVYTSRLPQTTAVLPLTTPIPWPTASDLAAPGTYLTTLNHLTPPTTA
ncbi:hypothetical protein PUR61_38655 [Streptomyces sp. BE20]|uniref:hypothetical protein n=1 Tax=Streptomyces sp. BE20 TaxID=3002525 RepID=UPI002E7A09EC|nr:hypothetical protein [Streptomyces sp. BE20]MEE1828058.1 hypothetical protein [Streptomyces sp. BE20]